MRLAAILIMLVVTSSAHATNRATVISAAVASSDYLRDHATPAKQACGTAMEQAGNAKEAAFDVRPDCNDPVELANGDEDMILYFELVDGTEFCTGAKPAYWEGEFWYQAAWDRYEAATHLLGSLDERANNFDVWDDPYPEEWQNCADEFNTAKDEWADSVAWFNSGTDYSNAAKVSANDAKAHWLAGNTGPGTAPWTFIEVLPPIEVPLP